MAARKTTTKTTTKKATSAKEVATEIKNAAVEAAVEGTAKVAEVVDETKKTVEKKASAAKKTVKKVVKKETVVTATVEFYGRSVLVSDIAAKATDAYKASHDGAEIETLNLYIKPEENAAYYVVNGESSADFQVEL